MITFSRSCCFALTAACLAASGWSAEPTLRFTVQAGKVAREFTPVTIPVRVSAETAQQNLVKITDASGAKLFAQLTKPSLLAKTEPAGNGTLPAELHFILPKLAAGGSATFTTEFKAPAVEKSPAMFQWSDTSKAQGEKDQHAEQSRELRQGDRPIMRYMHTALNESSKEARMGTYKPYHHVYDPAGKRYLTKGPGGVFPHHRGLYFGFNRISYGDKKTADTWHCNKGEDESHLEFVSEEAGLVLGRHRMTIDWHGQQKDTFAVETREMTAYNRPGGILIEFATRLESKVGPVKLDGDPQHAGFQFRATQDVPDKTAKQTYYLRPDGRGEPGQFRNWDPKNTAHKNLPWNALSFVVEGQRYTCCYLDRPENPKEARFSERDYGRFGSYFEYEMDTNKPLELNYRIWLQAGEMEVAQVQQLDDDFTQPVSVKLN